jgi:hypothetical protein
VLMTARPTRPIVRAMWIIPALTCMVAGFTWSAQPARAQAANPAAPAAGQAPDAPGGAQTPDTTSTTTPKPAAQSSDCKRSVAALSGDPKEQALLNAADVKDMAKGQGDLLTCRAVKEDSDAPCRLLGDESAIKSCRALRSIFHELREYPNGRAFMFNDVQFEECQNFPPLAAHCDQFRAAARAADASKCAALGDFQSNCRALILLDKSLCTPPKGDSLQAHDEGKKETYSDNLRKDCERQVQSMAIYAKGLQAVADSGPRLERQLAKAALRQQDACTPFATAAAKACNARAAEAAPPSESQPAAPGGNQPAPTPHENPTS